MNRSFCLVLGLIGLGGCGGPSGGDASTDAPRDATTDASPTADRRAPCASDRDCDDAVYCNGAERCMPGASGADGRGCVMGAAPCAAPQVCDEAMRRCTGDCPDADHDGHRAASCGGDDCDDADDHRFPGNTEVCDTAHHDEDCNAATFGTQDGDHDSFVADTCCNVDLNGQNVCGSDCNDGNASAHPGVPEACNGVDDNCNGAVDEGVVRTFFADSDHDNFGDRAGTPTYACAPSAGFAENSLDCDDSNASISPVATELCNGIDDNCNGAADETPASAFACSQQYGTPANTNFTCTAGACAATCPGTYLDCDARLDNGCETDGNSDPQHCGACATNCGTGGVCTAGHCDTIVSISAGSGYSCAVRSSHRAVCWGANAYGQLGDGTGRDQSTPVLVRGLDNVSSIEASRFPENFIWHVCPATCAMNGVSLVCWGCNEFGTLGIGYVSGVEVEPGSAAIGLPAFDMLSRTLGTTTRYSVGGSMVLAVENTGRDNLYSWGSNFFNFSPLLQRTGATTPDPTPGITTLPGPMIIAASAGATHACSLSVGFSAGGLQCWGQNISGQIGNGTFTSSQYAGVAPTVIPAPAGAIGWHDVSAGSQFTCAISDDGAGSGRLFCWGFDGIVAASPSPTFVGGPTNASKVVTGNGHACALLTDHTVVCWGANRSGALGDGTTTDSMSPVAVTGLSNVAQISAGDQRTCALTMDGVPYCWGDGATAVPTRVPGI